jgi:hypothetical protein
LGQQITQVYPTTPIQAYHDRRRRKRKRQPRGQLELQFKHRDQQVHKRKEIIRGTRSPIIFGQKRPQEEGDADPAGEPVAAAAAAGEKQVHPRVANAAAAAPKPAANNDPAAVR